MNGTLQNSGWGEEQAPVQNAPASNLPQEQKMAAAGIPQGTVQGTPSKIAAPPPEVSIRTMASDIRSLAETGGLRPEPQKVAVQVEKKRSGMGASLLTIISVIIILLLIGAIIYLFFLS